MTSLGQPIQRPPGRSRPRPVPVPREPARREVALRNGARAEAEGDGEDEALRVFSDRGELLFEYDAASGKTRVAIPEGDLEIVTKRGGIDFVAAKRIRLFSREPIEIQSLAGVRLAASALKGALSRFELLPKRMELASEELEVDAEQGELRIRETRFSGKKLSGWVESAKLAMQRSETVAGTVIEKAKNVYRSVDELAQLEAGRVRTFVSDLYQLRSRTASLKAKQAFKVDGEKIHLG